MKKHIITIIPLIFIMTVFFTKTDVSLLEMNCTDYDSCIFDRQQSDIEALFDNANSNKTTLPELHNSITPPSYRLITSQKKTQQNLINNILLKRFSFEAKPTKNHNIKFSSPLSSKDNLIVIVRHLII